MKRPLTQLIVLAGLAASLPASAQTTFSSEKILFRNNAPGSTRLADLDGDGDNEVLISGSSGIFLLENTDGAGALGPQAFLGSGRVEHLADIDGDTRLDLVSSYAISTTSTNRVIAWHRNLGGLAFSDAIVIRSTERSATVLAPADFDGDLDLDVPWVDSISDILEWADNTDGTGMNFAAPATALSNLSLLNVALHDLNGDLLPDFVAQDWKNTGNANDDEIVWYPALNTMPLTFGPPQIIAGGGTGLIAVANLDGDSDLDVLTTGSPVGTVEWRANNGTGSFGAAQPVLTASSSIENVSVVNLDGDSDVDIVYSVRFEEVFWAENTNGAGSFSAPVPIATPDLTFNDVSVGDLTGDNIPDVVTTEDFLVAMHPNINNGASFGPPSTVVEAIDWLNDLFAIDLDGDTDPEIGFGTQDGKLFCIPNLGDGFFDPASKIGENLGQLSFLEAANFDHLGSPDFVSLRQDDDIVGWQSGAGGCSFNAVQNLDTSGDSPGAVASGDFDGNGTLDFAVAYGVDNSCAWFSQNPVGTFTKIGLSGTVSGARSIATGNLDGSPGLDLVTASTFSGGNKVMVYYNTNGAGAFSSATEVGTMTGSTSQVEVADLDGDTDLDIIAMESDGARSNVVWFPNDGSGTFAAGVVVYDVSAGVREMAVGDLDGDGDNDFVTANSNSDQTRWHENDGSGGFDPTGVALETDPGSSPYNVKLADLDGDGDLDILNSSRFRGVVGWYENQLGEDAFTKWAKTFGLRNADLDPCADSDNDGIKLLEEFAYNLNPSLSDRSIVPTTGTFGLPNLWFTFGSFYRARGTFIRRRDYAEIGLTYIIERTPDLETWTELTLNSASNLDQNYQRISYNRTVSGKPPIHFQRIRLDYNPPMP